MIRTEENQTDWQFAHNICVRHASKYNLEHEVVSLYKEWTRTKVLTRAEYIQHAHDALYEWDI